MTASIPKLRAFVWIALVCLQICPLVPTAAADGSSARPKHEHFNPTRDRRVQAIIRAHGGYENLRAYMDMPKEWVGFSQEGDNDQLFPYVEFGCDRRWVMRSFVGTEVDAGYNGHIHWTKSGNRVVRFSQSEESEARHFSQLAIAPLLLSIDRSARITSVPSTLIDGIQCEGISVHQQGLDDIAMWTDPKTNLIRRLKGSWMYPLAGMGMTEQTNDYSEYRCNYGCVMPFRKVVHNNDKLSFCMNTVFVDKVSGIPTIFDPPKAPPLIGHTVRLPFQFEAMLMVIKAKINGHEAKLMLDTGAARSSISSEFMKRAEIQPLADFNVEGYGIFSSTKRAVAVLDNFQIGKINMENVRVRVRTESDKRFDGSIGDDLLRHFRLRIDFTNNQIVLSPNSDEPAGIPTAVVSLKLLGLPYTLGSIDGLPESACVIDTGSASEMGAVFFDYDSLERFLDDHASETTKLGFSVDSNGKKRAVLRTTIPKATVGDVKVADVRLSLIECPKWPGAKCNIIGRPFLQRYGAVEFDFQKEQLLLFDRDVTLRSVSPNWNSAGN